MSSGAPATPAKMATPADPAVSWNAATPADTVLPASPATPGTALSPRVPILKPLLLDIPETLETPRLVLRSPRPGDGPLVNAAILGSLAELKPWMPWADPTPKVEESEEFARSAHAAFLARKELNWLFLLKETGELAGIGGFHTIDWKVPRGEIGYWACTRFAGRGLVHEAVDALTRLGFGEMGLVRIEIRCDQRNERSAWVARAAGYPLEGMLLRQSRGVNAELCDMLLFARVAMPPAPAGYSIRPPCREDLPAIRDLQVAADLADGTERADSLARLEELFEDPWSNPQTDAFVARDASGAVAAWGRTFLKPSPALEARLHLTLDTHPDHRSEAISAAFFECVEARARERLAAVPAGIPRHIVVPLDVRDETRRAFLDRRGYRLERVFFRMRRDLRKPITEPAALPPADLSMVSWRPELDSAFHAAFNETFADHWSFQPVSADEWRQALSGSSTFRADLTRGLFHGEELVGFSMNFVDPEENERVGRRQAWIGQIGVRRAWRKRGLATALLCDSMRAFRAAGLEWAVLMVDAESLTGAVGVYERVGFRTVLQTVVYALTL